MPRRIEKRATTPADATMSETSSEPSLYHEGVVIIPLLKPIGCIGKVLIDLKAPTVKIGEIRMMQSWCSDLLRR